VELTFTQWVTKQHSQTQAQIVVLRDKLAAAAATENYGDLGHYVNQLATAYGALSVIAPVDGARGRLESGEVSLDAVRDHVMREVLRSSNDTFSGRGNDARRAEFDGRREMAGKISDFIRYNCDGDK
jgi:hypothetical protein